MVYLEETQQEFTSEGVGDPSRDYYRQSPDWRYIDDVLEGTKQIRLKAQEYLPQEPFEHRDTYLQRLNRSVVIPYLSKIQSVITATVSSNPPKLEEADDLFLEQTYDLDGNRTNLNEFSKELFKQSITYGHSVVLIDLPNYQTTPNEKIRPYWKIYNPKDILGWRISSDLTQPELLQIRLRDWVMVPYKRYDTRLVQRIKVFEPGRFAIYQEKLTQNSSEYINYDSPPTTTFELIEEGTHPLNYVPVVPLYSNKLAELISKPPLLEVADLNLAHYRLMSDYHWILHVAAVPQLVIKGVQNIKPIERPNQVLSNIENQGSLTPEQKELARLRAQLRQKQEEDKIVLGPNESLLLPENSDAFYLEPEGKCFQALSSEIDRIESRIVELGATVLTRQKNQAETAESKRLDRLQSDHTLTSFVDSLELALNRAFKVHADYYGTEPPLVVIPHDFDNEPLDSNSIKQLMELWLKNAITQETLLKMLERGEIFNDIKGFDITEELLKTSQSQQPLIVENGSTSNTEN